MEDEEERREEERGDKRSADMFLMVNGGKLSKTERREEKRK